jgi:hypothetical protein
LWKAKLTFNEETLAIIIVKQACTLQLEQSYAEGAIDTKVVLGNLDVIPQALGGFNQ